MADQIERGKVIRKYGYGGGFARDANGKEVYFHITEAALVVPREGAIVLMLPRRRDDNRRMHRASIPAVGHFIVFRRRHDCRDKAAAWASAKHYDNLLSPIPPQEASDV